MTTKYIVRIFLRKYKKHICEFEFESLEQVTDFSECLNEPEVFVNLYNKIIIDKRTIHYITIKEKIIK